MADERIDIVNSDNIVIGQVMKSEAHVKGFLHRTILAEIINSKAEWILVKQASDRQDKGQYVSPIGGHIRAGEPEIEALKREAMEEAGLVDFMYKYIGKAVWNRFVNNKVENHLFILYEIYSDREPVLNEESVEFRRFTQNELNNEMKNNPQQFGDAWFFATRTFYPDKFL